MAIMGPAKGGGSFCTLSKSLFIVAGCSRANSECHSPFDGSEYRVPVSAPCEQEQHKLNVLLTASASHTCMCEYLGSVLPESRLGPVLGGTVRSSSGTINFPPSNYFSFLVLETTYVDSQSAEPRISVAGN